MLNPLKNISARTVKMVRSGELKAGTAIFGAVQIIRTVRPISMIIMAYLSLIDLQKDFTVFVLNYKIEIYI